MSRVRIRDVSVASDGVSGDWICAFGGQGSSISVVICDPFTEIDDVVEVRMDVLITVPRDSDLCACRCITTVMTVVEENVLHNRVLVVA